MFQLSVPVGVENPTPEKRQGSPACKTCQREARKGEARSLGKTLNGHERDHRYANTKNVMYLQYANVVQYVMIYMRELEYKELNESPRRS